MPTSTYESTIQWLFEQFPSYQLIGEKAYKPTLENTLRLASLFDEPQSELRFIHVAGSNGKGSVSSMTASILTESGYKIGLFTSPHIKDFRERIRVNGQMIDHDFVVDFVKKVKDLKLDFSPSFFEITFIMALAYFRDQKIDLAVIETGLGGRLDATNIITPLVSIITNISLEHTHLLGNTLQEIAGEKAGIIKPGIPIVIGEKADETEHVFLKKANSSGSPIYFSNNKLIEDGIKMPLLGSYQKENLKVVLTALEILETRHDIHSSAHIQTGLDRLIANTGFFGRMHIIQNDPMIIFDVSHNLAGITATLSFFEHQQFDRLHILYGSSSDKDVLPILEALPKEAELNLTCFSNSRSLSKNELASLLQVNNIKAQLFTDPNVALKKIRAIAGTKDCILVIGSFFLLSDLIKDEVLPI